jgi:hypothetical protein
VVGPHVGITCPPGPPEVGGGGKAVVAITGSRPELVLAVQDAEAMTHATTTIVANVRGIPPSWHKISNEMESANCRERAPPWRYCEMFASVAFLGPATFPNG